MAESSGVWRAVKYGCGGCLALVVLAALAVALLVGYVSTQSRDENVQDHALTPDLPPPPVTAEAPTLSLGAGRVVLDLKQAGFVIEPAAAGTPLRVEARYDEKAFVLTERLDTGGDEWVYRVGFRRTGGTLMATVRHMLGGTTPTVRVLIPRDRRLSLELHAEQGAVQARLGGLWLVDAELWLNKGGFELAFDEPLHEPMRRLAIHGSMGGMDATRIGNASPAELIVDYSMGGMALDLNGPWAQDAKISLKTSMAGGAVRLPRDVHIEGIATSGLGLDAPGEVPRPTLRFDVVTARGEIEFTD